MAATHSETQKRPWYLRKVWVYVMCFICLPVGVINVVIHRNVWEREERRGYIGVIIILSFFWVLNLLPY
ncbi:hypothetical protein JNUCC1_01645 [Lentibacillus sp. JNUCC-1]|nr:hypothetical protein [Lentibacillus sp. JNUCC-1]